MIDDLDRAPREVGPQPDPMLREGRSGSLWVWFVGIIAAGVIVATLVALSPPAPNMAGASSNAPQQAQTVPAPLSPGRNTANAPAQGNQSTTGSGSTRQ